MWEGTRAGAVRGGRVRYYSGAVRPAARNSNKPLELSGGIWYPLDKEGHLL